MKKNNPCRSSAWTIPAKTRRYLTSYLHISIFLPQLGNNWLSGLCADICESGRTISYIETISNKTNSLHTCIPFSDIRDFQRAYKIQTELAIRTLNLGVVELALDGKQYLFFLEKGRIISETNQEQGWCG